MVYRIDVIWPVLIFTILTTILLIFSTVFYIKTYDEYRDWSDNITFAVVAIIFIFGIFCGVDSSFKPILESRVFDYELVAPLKYSVDVGIRNKITIDEDVESRDIQSREDGLITKTFDYKKGDKVRIKTIEDLDGYFDKNKYDYKNARAFLVFDDEVYEIPDKDFNKQELDKKIKELYKEYGYAKNAK